VIDTNKILVVGDRVLVRPEEDLHKTNSGLYLPPGVAEKEKVQGGYVIKTGPGYAIAANTEEDEPWKETKPVRYIPLQATPGDFALFLRRDSIEIEIKGEKYLIIPHSSILILHREDFLEN